MKTLAKQFNLKIQYNKQSVGRPKNNLSPEELDWLTTFFERPDITYTLPGMKDHKYMGKKDGESVYKQKRYLLWTLGEIVDIFNGMSAGESGEGCFPVKFGKKLLSGKFIVLSNNIPSLFSIKISRIQAACARYVKTLFT